MLEMCGNEFDECLLTARCDSKSRFGLHEIKR